MNLSPTPDQETFRAECRRWLEQNLPGGYGRGLPLLFDDLAEEVAFLRGWQAALAEARFVGVAWPAAYGGRGAGPLHHYIVQEELARAGAPELVGRIGVNLIGPTILAHGTTEQQQRWLPSILPAHQLFCQLFSEPDAGSDLASLSTSATPTNGGWLLNGQKVWTSYAQFADWGLCLARSHPAAPKHQGITAFVIDMHTDGVEIRPLRQITGEADFNEVFLNDVFVADDQVLGPPGEGWRVSQSTLGVERGTNPRQLVIHIQLLDELLRAAAETGQNADLRIRQSLARAYTEVRLFQLQNWRVLSRLTGGHGGGPEAATAKLFWSEMSQRLHETALEVLGPAALLWRDDPHNPGGGRWQRSWLYYRAASIFAGTSEIQRNIIGERTLGLPRESRKE
ncbi:acyl-CoA dehydrogenase family protein [Candidatus Poriferisocius sp.]|uniref:acyl-CoA dehydrogenase family protein n=1 Tax=Candidatus Poriferisocius sp. TaxID=3101276 RepID=UPI003B0289FC